jgi:cobalt-zinc-cadmium efflux system outer membrane protein
MRKFFSAFLLFIAAYAFSQQAVDTLSVTLAQAEEQFLKNNYFLLANKFSVDASKALVRQAGLFNNPNIYYENSVYNRYSGKYFPTALGKMGDASTQGEFVVQYNWLFSIAGKRNKSVKVARAQADVAQYQFDDLIRTLMYALRSDFYELYYGIQSLSLFDTEIGSLTNIVAGFETQYQKGNISLRELTRVRALLFSLQSDRFNLYTNLQETQKEFLVLLNSAKNAWYKPQMDEATISSNYSAYKIVLSDLVTLAQQTRPDLKAVQSQVTADEANVALQKAIAVPDLMLQGVFDRNGSYIPNYNAAAISVPISAFNRNQGNIAAAKALAEGSKQLLQQKQTAVQNDVFASVQKILESEKMNASLSPDFKADFNTVLSGAQSNFEKKNLSLLEFIDLFESYKTAVVQYNQVRSQRFKAFEELNFSVGKDLFKK